MAKQKKRASTDLGARIRRLRKKEGLSLEELARQTGLSVPYLERVEAREEIPTVGSILQLSRALALDASVLLPQAERQQQASRKRESYDKRKGAYGYKTLSPGAATLHLKAFLVTIDPHQDHGMVEYRHEGEEFIYVLDGELTVTVGETRHELRRGKSLHFNSSVPHMLTNPGSDKTELLVVLYTP